MNEGPRSLALNYITRENLPDALFHRCQRQAARTVSSDSPLQAQADLLRSLDGESTKPIACYEQPKPCVSNPSEVKGVPLNATQTPIAAQCNSFQRSPKVGSAGISFGRINRHALVDYSLDFGGDVWAIPSPIRIPSGKCEILDIVVFMDLRKKAIAIDEPVGGHAKRVDIREALHRQPFEPFSIRLADGRSLPVPHPDFVALGPRRMVVVATDDSWSVVEPLLIVSLDHNGSHSSTPPDAGSSSA